MERFKFLHDNYIATTAVMTVDSGTTTVEYLFDTDPTTQWQSSGYDAGTVTTLTWTPSADTITSRIVMCNHNFGNFRIYYDGVTANVFTPDLAATSNTAAYLYLEFATQTVSSISIDVTNTYPLNEEKKCGWLYIGDEHLEFPFNPTSDNYDPIVYRKGTDKEMADGGMISIFLDKKFRANMSLSFVPEANRDNFLTLWDLHEEFMFIPYAVNGFTTTSQWDGDMYRVVWIGDFDFYKLSSNLLGNGYSGFINIAETPD